MTTLKKIKMDGEGVIDKMKRLESLTKEDLAVIKIYNSLYGGRARNAGKRKNSQNIQKAN